MNSFSFGIIFLFQFIILVSCSSDKIEYYINLIQKEQERAKTFVLPTDSKSSQPFRKTYYEYGTFDHIVVGAGSAGAVVASRLSEDPMRYVLLLEAGGNETDFTDIPSMGMHTLNLEYNWNYFTVPQNTSCLGKFEKRCPYPRGKMIGGSSGVNGLGYVRGNKKDFDTWCSQGNPGWCYEDLLPIFKKSENSLIYGDPYYHGYGGYLNVEYTRPMTKNHIAFLKANKELNRKFVDYNGKHQVGVGRVQFNLKHGSRGSTGRMFLRPVMYRKNLNVQTNSHVTRIMVNPKTKKAFGVLFAKDNVYYVARSRKDIIVSAGTIGSPQLLMLSGIGPRSHLESMNIPVKQDLSVGKNLQDHVQFSMLAVESNVLENKKSLEENLRDYINGFGELTDLYNAKVISFVQTNLTDIDDVPDIEIVQTSLYGTDYVSSDKHTLSDVNFDRSFTISVVLLHPVSKGYIELKSANPFEYPIIDTQLLSDSCGKDIDTLYEGIQLGLQFLNTNAFKEINARLYKIHLPACRQFKYFTKDYWYCHIRQLSSSYAHIVGTCKMGPDPMDGAVVDHKLKVYGIKNLRVADASIMPTIPRAHTNAATIMIGEKAAEMILYE